MNDFDEVDRPVTLSPREVEGELEDGLEDDFEVASLAAGVPGLTAASPGSSPRGSPSASRLSFRRRVIAGLVVAGSVMLALVVVLGTLPDAQAMLRRTFHLPVAPTPSSDAGELLLENVVPWGQLSVDGRIVTQEQLAPGLPDGYEGIQLSPGRHTLTYVADHFSPMTCTLSVPGGAGDTCPSGHDPGAASATGVAQVLDLGASPDRLSQADRDQLIAAVNATLLPSTASIVPGERFGNMYGQPVVASQSLTATLRLLVATTPTSFANLCFILCSAGLGTQYPSGWNILADVDVSWTFTAADGQVATSSNGGIALGGLTHLLPVIVNSQNGAWEVDSRDSDSNARVLSDALADGVRQSWSDYPLHDEYPAGWAVVSYIAPNPANGAMIEIGAPNAVDGLPTGDTIQLLYRFGLLLAANDHAQRTFPQLPVASAAELDQWHAVATAP